MGIVRIPTEPVSQFRAIQTEVELARNLAKNQRLQEAGQQPSLFGALDEVDILSPEGRESYARLALLSRQEIRRMQEEENAALRQEENARRAEERRAEAEERARQAAAREKDETGGEEQDDSAAAAGDNDAQTPLERLDQAAQAASDDDRATADRNGFKSEADGLTDAPAQADGTRGRKTPFHLVV